MSDDDLDRERLDAFERGGRYGPGGYLAICDEINFHPRLTPSAKVLFHWLHHFAQNDPEMPTVEELAEGLRWPDGSRFLSPARVQAHLDELVAEGYELATLVRAGDA